MKLGSRIAKARITENLDASAKGKSRILILGQPEKYLIKPIIQLIILSRYADFQSV